MNIHLTVLTCVPNKLPKLNRRLPHLMVSLLASGFPIDRVSIVDDYSTEPEHLHYLEELRRDGIHVVSRPKRGGISRAKNTCLRVLREKQFNFGFLMEDDMEVSPDWWKPYVALHQKAHIQHFSWASDKYFSNMKKSVQIVRGARVIRCSRLNGALLTFTPRVLDLVGGFKVLPAKWGYEHIQYTRRCVRAKMAPFYADIPNSERVVRLSPYARFTCLDHPARQKSNQANKAAARKFQLREPIKE